MKRILSLCTILVLVFAVSYSWAAQHETFKSTSRSLPIEQQQLHTLIDNPTTLSSEKLQVVNTNDRQNRQGVDVVWADDFELETLYAYYVSQTYFWEAPTEYPEYAVRYTPYHSGTVEGAWFYWYEGDATEVTLTFYDDDAGYPGTVLDTYAITPDFSGWYYYDLSSMGLAVTSMEDIYMSFQVTGGTYIQVISDDGSGSANRSYVHDGTDWLTILDAEGGDYEWNMDLVVANTDAWENPSGEWNYIDTYSHSQIHSWWIPEDPGLYLAAIESPVFILPDDYSQYFISEWVDIEFFRSSAGPGSIDETFRLWMRNADAPTPDYWQITEFNAYDGNSWWCGIEDAGFEGGWGYGDNWDQFIETPEITLTTTGNISLDFMTRWDSELDWDYGYIRISDNDFQSYDVLAEYTGTNNTWTAQSIDLTTYANQTVKLRFQFISDSNTSDETGLDTEGAWFIDDVVISDDARTIFFEDDADANVNFLINPGNVAWDLMYYDYDRDYPDPSLGWELIDKDHIFNGSTDVTDYAGNNVQIRFTVSTDDSTFAQGAGCYVDDFEIVGSNMPPFDAACMFNVIPYPTTEDIDINPGIVYGNMGQNPINPTLRMDIEGQGGPFDYTASNPGEIASGEFGLGYLNPLPTTALVEGNFDFTGTVIVGSDENPDNDNYTINIDVNEPGMYELGYNSRIWDETYYTTSYSGSWFTPFTDGLFTEFTLNSVKALMINYGTDNHIEVETVEIWEAIDDVTPGDLIYTEDFDYTGAPPGEHHWAEFVLSEPQVLTEDFFITIGGEHTNNPAAEYNLLFDNMVRQYLGQGAYTIHTIYWDDENEVWAHSSGDRFINAVGTVEMEETDPPENVAVDEITGLVTWDPPGGGGTIEELIYDNGVSTGGYSYVGYSMGTQMSPAEPCQILELKIYTSSGTEFNAEVWGWDNDAPTEDLYFQELTPATASDWVIVDVSGEDLMMDGDFVVAFGSINADTFMGYDENLNNGRSWDHNDAGGWSTWDEAYLIRSVVQYSSGRIVELSPTITPKPNPSVVASERVSIDFEDVMVGNSRELDSYNVYLDGTFEGNTTDTEYLLEDLVSGETYMAGVSAVYTEGGESEIIEVEFTFIGVLDPPENVEVDEGTGMVSWNAPGGALFFDDFDSYTAGEYLCVQSDDWNPWSNNPGGNDDAYVSDVQAYSGSNSVLVDDGSLSDIIHLFGDLTTGVYDVGIWLYLEPGYGGYYNLLHEFSEWRDRTTWAQENYFGADGNGYIIPGEDPQVTFTHPTGSWFQCVTTVDLDNDWAEYYVDGTLVHSWTWSSGGMNQLGAIDIYAAAPSGDSWMFYFDDFCIADVSTREVEGYNVYLDEGFQGYTTDTEYQLIDLTNGQTYTAGVSAVYTEGESDIIEVVFTYTGEDTGNPIIPAKTALSGNYPNPFNPTTTIQYQLKENSHVNLEIFNMKGQKVKTLVNTDMEAGYHNAVWNGTDQNGRGVSSGIYFYKMKAGRYTSTKKMILMK